MNGTSSFLEVQTTKWTAFAAVLGLPAVAGSRAGLHGVYGQPPSSYTIGNLSYTPDSRIAQLMDTLFSEVARTQRMGVYA